MLAEIDDRPSTWRVLATHANGDTIKVNCVSAHEAFDQAGRIDAKNPYGAPAMVYEVFPGGGNRWVRRPGVSRR